MEYDEELIDLSISRKSALKALADGPKHRRDLQKELGYSKTTCHRIISSFDEYGILRRSDKGYELTPVGRTVWEHVSRFEGTIKATCQLEPLIEAFETAEVDFNVELFADATITRPQPEDPSPPINRYLELFRESNRVYTIDRTVFIPPLYFEEIYELGIEDDKRGAAIYPESIIKQRLSNFPEKHRHGLQRDQFNYRVYEGIPFGMTLYDEHVGLRAYNDETGALLMFVDTDNPEAVAWGEDVYDHYREQSEPISTIDGLPDWVTDEM